MQGQKEEVEMEVADKFTIGNCHYTIMQPTEKMTDKEMNEFCSALADIIYGD